MSGRTILGFALAVAVAVASAGCSEEGSLEKVGREIDEVTEEIVDEAHALAGEGKLERAGRKIDDAAEDAEEDLEEALGK